MLKMMRTRLNKDEGFTLIELMVVVLIIAILVAIAIPTFLGQRKNAQDSAAKSDLRNGLATEKAYYSVNQVFSADDAPGGELADIEPNLFGLPAGDEKIDTVLVAAADDAVCLATASDSGTWFAIWDGANSGTQYGTHTADPFAGACVNTGPPALGTWSTAGW